MSESIKKFDNFLNEGKYEDRYEEWIEKNGDFPIDNSLGSNEFEDAYDWINLFGGETLLSNRHIRNGINLFDRLKSGKISINEIDIATEGDNGQEGGIPFSETKIAKDYIIPLLTKM